MERLFTITVFLSAVLTVMLGVTMVLPGPTPFLTAEGSGLAALTLFASLPLVDEGLVGSGRRIGPFASGLALGVPLFFFVQQQRMATAAGLPAISVGADKVLVAGFALSLLLRGARMWIRSYRRDRSSRPC